MKYFDVAKEYKTKKTVLLLLLLLQDRTFEGVQKTCPKITLLDVDAYKVILLSKNTHYF